MPWLQQTIWKLNFTEVINIFVGDVNESFSNFQSSEQHLIADRINLVLRSALLNEQCVITHTALVRVSLGAEGEEYLSFFAKNASSPVFSFF